MFRNVKIRRIWSSINRKSSSWEINLKIWGDGEKKWAKIWKSRLVNIGSLNITDAYSYGVTGPIIRSAGIKKDMRFKDED
jgi:hypothetical protein